MKLTKPWCNRDVILWKNSTGSYCKTSADILERNNSNNTIFFYNGLQDIRRPGSKLLQINNWLQGCLKQ